MSNKNSNKFSLFIISILLSVCTNTHALENSQVSKSSVNIPMMSDAQVFADFTDDMPAVLNYFTSATEEIVVDFYQQHYNGFLKQERKRGRLTLTYQQDNHEVRVVISQQNKKRQVDVIVELKE